MLLMSLYVHGDNICEVSLSVHLSVLVPALHGDEVRRHVLPPGLLASQWFALLGQGYEHFLAVFSPFCGGVRVEVVF